MFVIEEAEGEVGAGFSRDEIEVDLVKGVHSLVGNGVNSRWATFSFICSRSFAQ